MEHPVLLWHVGADVGVVHSDLVAEAELVMKGAFASVPAFEVGGHIVELGDYGRTEVGW